MQYGLHSQNTTSSRKGFSTTSTGYDYGHATVDVVVGGGGIPGN